MGRQPKEAKLQLYERPLINPAINPAKDPASGSIKAHNECQKCRGWGCATRRPLMSRFRIFSRSGDKGGAFVAKKARNNPRNYQIRKDPPPHYAAHQRGARPARDEKPARRLQSGLAAGKLGGKFAARAPRAAGWISLRPVVAFLGYALM